MFKYQATRYTAFIAGFILGATASGLEVARAHSLVSFTLDSPNASPFVAIYFFVSVLLLVIGPQMLTLKAFERIPHTNIPKTREGWRTLVQTWGRMLVWFFGAATGGALLSLIGRGL